MTDEKEEYVKIKTNMPWYNTDQIIYRILYLYLMGFLAKIKNHTVVAKPSMSKLTADSIGAVYNIDISDYVEREVPHPSAGEEVYSFLGFDEDGEIIFGEPEQIAIDAKVMTVPLDGDTVLLDLPATLEHFIAEYEANDWDEMSDWWAKASQIVPFLWD